MVLEDIISMATIYKIWSEKGDKVYIGSTNQKLHRRMLNHSTNRSCSSHFLFEEYGLEFCKIEPIEEVKEDERDQRERYWIEFYKDVSVNIVLPGRSRKEYYEANREAYSLYHKRWRERNRDCRNQYKREYNATKVNCPHCDLVLRKSSLSLHLKRKHPSAQASVEEN